MTHLIDISVFWLLTAGVVVSIIELGLTADVVSWFDDDHDWWDSFESRSDFLLFCSIWTILVTGFLIAIPFLGRSIYGHKFLAPATLALTSVTMIFWLAGFAAFANLFEDAPTGTVGATLAFAIIAWLTYLGLLVLNIITALSVRESDRPGWTPFARVHKVEKRSSGTAA